MFEEYYDDDGYRDRDSPSPPNNKVKKRRNRKRTNNWKQKKLEKNANAKAVTMSATLDEFYGQRYEDQEPFELDFEFDDYHDYNQPYESEFVTFQNFVSIPPKEPSKFSIKNAMLLGLLSAVIIRRADRFDRKNLFLVAFATYVYKDFHKPLFSFRNTAAIAGGIYCFNKTEEVLAIAKDVFETAKDIVNNICEKFLPLN